MKNQKVNKFANKIAELVVAQKNVILEAAQSSIESFSSINFIVFGCGEEGNNIEITNRIIFAYSDHSGGNSGTSMSVCSFYHHPHNAPYDRGYIKGVSTDLEGYMKLKTAWCIDHDLIALSALYRPFFKKSKNSDSNNNECANIQSAAIKELDAYVLVQHERMNQQLKALTGCSLLHYMRAI